MAHVVELTKPPMLATPTSYSVTWKLTWMNFMVIQAGNYIKFCGANGQHVGRTDDLAHVELEDISENVVSQGAEKSENSMEDSPLVFEGDDQKPFSLFDLLDMLLVKQDKIVQVLKKNG